MCVGLLRYSIPVFSCGLQYVWDYCTDEISTSDVNRHKTSLPIIHICLKKYIAINVYVNFNFILFLWPRCSYLMFHPPLPLSQLLILIPLSLALPHLFPTPGLGRGAHVIVVKLATIWRSSLSGPFISSPSLQYPQ